MKTSIAIRLVCLTVLALSTVTAFAYPPDGLSMDRYVHRNDPTWSPEMEPGYAAGMKLGETLAALYGKLKTAAVDAEHGIEKRVKDALDNQARGEKAMGNVWVQISKQAK